MIYKLYRRWRYRFRCYCSRSPMIYSWLTRLKQFTQSLDPKLVTDQTDFVMEAFPRSGNTFAYFAFMMAQGETSHNIAHHYHAPAQIISGVRHQKPTVLIVRQPVDVVCSFVQRETTIPLKQALKAWIDFHECLLPYGDQIIVALFDQVTSDFGQVIDRVNVKYSTEFGRFDHTQAHVDACFKAIEERNAQRFGEGKMIESWVARPSDERKAEKRKIKEAYDRPELAKLRNRADELYQKFATWAEK